MQIKLLPACALAILLQGCAGTPAQSPPIVKNLHSCPAGSLPAGVYVSTDGNDANAGTVESPLASLAGAQALVRTRSDKPTICLRGGTYELQSPLVLTAADAGLTIQGLTCESATVSGGRSIMGWQKVSDHLWKAPANFVFHQMFIDGERMERARSSGFMHVDGLVDNHDPLSFAFHSDDISPMWVGGELIILQTWAENRLPIRAVDANSLTVTLANSMLPWMVEANARYYVENVSDLLRSPGQWYLDQQNGSVFYIPRAGEDISKEDVTGSNLETLIVMKGAVDITISGLTFSYTDWNIPANGYVDRQTSFDLNAAITADGVDNLHIANNRFAHLGENVAHISNGSRHAVFDNNEVTDIGGGGIWLGEGCTDIAGNVNAMIAGFKDCDWNAAPTEQNEITRNTIHDIGQVFPAAAGIGVLQSSYNKVCSNEVFNTFQTAISIGWTWGYGRSLAHDNLIAFNHAHDLGRGMLSDLGGIYTLGSQPGTVVRNNLVHDVTAFNYGGRGLYQDQGSSHILTESNIVYRAHSGSFVHNSDGEDNLVRNNLLALADADGQLIFADSPALARPPNPYSVFFDQNIFYWTSGPLLAGDWSTSLFGLNSLLTAPQVLDQLIRASHIQTVSNTTPCGNQ